MTVLGTCIYLRMGKFQGKSNIGENINNPTIHLPYELVFLIKTFNTGERLNRIFKEMKYIILSIGSSVVLQKF